MKKFIKDGKVAVLYSPGFGAGFSSWNIEFPQLVFDPNIVKILLDDKDNKYDLIKKYMRKKYTNSCTLGVDDLQIEWVDIGKKFRIHEYDGLESVILLEDETWFDA